MARNSKEDVDRTIKEMRKDLEKKIDAVRNELKEKGPEAAEKSLSDLKAGLGNKLSDAGESLGITRESVDDALEMGRTRIQEQPLLAIGVAFAVGAVIGLLFGRTGCKG